MFSMTGNTVYFIVQIFKNIIIYRIIFSASTGFVST